MTIFHTQNLQLGNQCPLRVQDFENKCSHNLLKIGDGIARVEKAAYGKSRAILRKGSNLMIVHGSHYIPIDIVCTAFLWHFKFP